MMEPGSFFAGTGTPSIVMLLACARPGGTSEAMDTTPTRIKPIKRQDLYTGAPFTKAIHKLPPLPKTPHTKVDHKLFRPPTFRFYKRNLDTNV